MSDLLKRLEAFGASISKSAPTGDFASQRKAIETGAAELGIDPVDYATAISYESAGSFDPWKAGPVTQWGQHRGTIQYGEPQRKKYKVYEGQSFEEQVTKSNVQYLKDAGVKPGMSFAQIYSAINGGSADRDLNTPEYMMKDGKRVPTGRTIADNISNAQRDHRARVLKRFGWDGSTSTTTYEAPKGPDFSELRTFLGKEEGADTAASAPDFSELRTFLGKPPASTDTAQPEEVNAISRPVAEAPVTPTNQNPTPSATPTPTAPVAPNKLVPPTQAQLQSAEPTITEEEDLPTLSRPRVMAPNKDAEARANSVIGTYTTDPKESAEVRLRTAANAVLGSYGVTPDRIESWIATEKAAGRPLLVGDKRNPETSISAAMLDDIMGAGTAQQGLQQERAEMELEEVPPSSLLTKDLYEKLLVTNPLLFAGTQDPILKAIALSAGIDLEAATGNAVAHIDTALGGTGARTGRFLAGMRRFVDPAVIAGIDDAPDKQLRTEIGPDGKERQVMKQSTRLRAFQGVNLYDWLQHKATVSENNERPYLEEGGLFTEILHMGIGLPSDLSRVMLASAVLPGGIVTASALDLAAQSAGRGESFDEVRRQAAKGAILGGLARVMVPVVRGVSANLSGTGRATSGFWGADPVAKAVGGPGSRAAGFGAGVATVGASTYVTSRAFGANRKDALKETMFNTVLAFGDAGIAALAGAKSRTVRVRNGQGEDFAVRIDSDGKVVETKLKPGENADLEIFDANKPIAVTIPKGFESDAYADQRARVTDLLAETSARPLDTNLLEATFSVAGQGLLKVDPAGNVVFGEALSLGLKSSNSFMGLYAKPNQVDAILDGFVQMHDDYASRGKTAEAKKVADLARLFEESIDPTGDLIVTTDLKGVAPDIERGLLQEEYTHRNNRRTTLRRMLDLQQVETGPKTTALAQGIEARSVAAAKELGQEPKPTDMAYQVDEAYAQAFRDDAPDHLGGLVEKGKTKKELRGVRKELYDSLENSSLDPVEYAAGVADVSKAGKAFDRYARMRARKKSENAEVIEQGDFVTTKADALGANRYVVHEVLPDGNVELVDATQFDESKKITLPMSELNLDTKLSEAVGRPERQSDARVEYADMMDADSAVPDINDIADYRKIDEPEDVNRALFNRSETPADQYLKKLQDEGYKKSIRDDDTGYRSQFDVTGRPDPYEPSPLETGLEDVNRARLYHGSRHRFPPEVLVEKPDGTTEYIAGKAEDYPQGTKVTRRGDKIIVRYPSAGPRLHFNKQSIEEIISGDPSSGGKADALRVLQEEWKNRQGSILRSVTQRTIQKLKDAEYDATWRAGGDTKDPAVVQAAETRRWAEANLNKVKPRETFQREVHSVKDFLPEIPEGYKVLKEYPLGRKRDDKINTGEGAQVRGYGHYDAEQFGVARSYRKAGAQDDNSPMQMYQGQEFEPSSTLQKIFDDNITENAHLLDESIDNDAISNVFVMMEQGYDAETAIYRGLDEMRMDRIRNADLIKIYPDDPHYQNQDTYYTKMIDKFESLDPRDFDLVERPSSAGYVYKLKHDIPDDKLLHLDKPIIDQPLEIQKVVEDFYDRLGRDFYDSDNPDASNPLYKRGEDVYQDLKDNKREIDFSPEFRNNKQVASDFLKDKGLKGLKFFDADSRHAYRKVVWKGELIGSIKSPSINLSYSEKVALGKVNGLVGDNNFTPEQAIKAARQDGPGYQAANDGFAVAEYEAFLQQLDPNDFKVESKEGTHNLVTFKGEDVDIYGIMFALQRPLKRGKVRDVADKKAITEGIITDFPNFAKWFGRKPTDAVDTPVDPDPLVEKRFQDAFGMPKKNFFSEKLDSAVSLYHSFRREQRDLNPNKSPEHARTADAFRRLSALPHWAKVKAQDTVAQIVMELGPNNGKTFERIVQLRDIQAEAEKGIQPDYGIADLDQVNESLAHFEAIAAKNPQVMKALETRDRLLKEVVTALVRLDLLPTKALDEPRYYHRQIMTALDTTYGSTGSPDVRLHRKGFQKTRQGEKGDYNTNYLESEAEWLAQAYNQLGKYDIQQEIEAAANTAPILKRDARLRGIADWTTLIDKKTHTLWQPKEGNFFFKVDTIGDEVVDGIIAGVIDPKKIQPELKEALALGKRKPEWVVPKEVATLLDNYKPDAAATSRLGKIGESINSSYKQWALLNPKNFAGYNLRNAISDLDVVMFGYPDAIGEIPGAYAMLRAYAKDKSSPEAALIHEAIKNGVIDSGQTFAEIPDINKIGVFKNMTPGKYNPMMTVWEGMKGFTSFRENMLRLAVYQHVKKLVDAGVPTYGGSVRKQVDAITDPTLKASKIAREFMGDYGGISESGRLIRRSMMPFYSWLEINAPRYVRVLKNTPHEGTPLLPRLGPAIVGKAAKVVVHAPQTAIRMAAITTGILLWNNFGPYAEYEEKLKRTDMGRQPHIITGVREDGTPMVIRAETGFTDALSWFGLGDGDADWTDVMTGRYTGKDKLAEAAKAPVDKLVNAIGLPKIAAELAFGRTAYPSLFEKGASLDWRIRPVRDRWEHAARMVAVDGVYRKVMGRPSPQDQSAVTMAFDTFLTSRVDVDEAVYYNARTSVSDYAKKIGKTSQSAEPTEKSNALFYYRQALKLNDDEAARRFLDQYMELGKAEGKTDKEMKEGMDRSMTKSHPLGGLDTEKWGEYIRQSSQENRNQLVLALRFYKERYDQKEAIGDEAGASVAELYRMVYPKPVRLIAENSTSITMAADIFENAELPDAERNRVKKAIKLKAIQKIGNQSLTMEDQAVLKRLGINLVTNATVKTLLKVGEQKKRNQKVNKARKYGYQLPLQ